MKLILENSQDIDVLKESKDSKKNYKIRGVFMESEVKNGNGRVYPKKTLEEAVIKYDKEYVSRNRGVGELDHPDSPKINSDRICCRTTKLWWEGNKVLGEAVIVPTPMGKIVEGLLDGGCQLGVSSRGLGSVSQSRGVTTVKEFMLRAIDVVQDPSAPTAFVDGIMEGVEWIEENGLFKPSQIEAARKEIHKTSMKDLEEAKIRVFEQFIKGLR